MLVSFKIEYMKQLLLFISIAVIIASCSKSNNGDLIFVEPVSSSNFNFPYFLFVPKQCINDEKVFIIIEPNNSGFTDDDLQKHIDKARDLSTNDYYLGNYLAQNLKYPLLVPVFPRSKSNWKIYTHALDRDVMIQKGNDLERIDLQLISMFHDAQVKLRKRNIRTQDKFLLTGFSASGTFVNRFAFIHPNNVLAVAAGGLNGLLMLPADSLNGEILNYPVGTNDLEAITNKQFDMESFLRIPQFYYMGQLDCNDAIPYDDAFDQFEREQIFRLLGKQMQPERWNNCIQIYNTFKVNSKIETFEKVGHKQPKIIKKEVIKFFREAIEKQL